MRNRRGSTIVNIAVFIVVILLFLSIYVDFFRKTYHDEGGNGGTVSVTNAYTDTNTISTNSSNTETDSTYCKHAQPVLVHGSSAPSLIESSVYTLPPLSIDNQSSANAELLNVTWWKKVFQSSDQTLIAMPQDTYWAFLNDSQ